MYIYVWKVIPYFLQRYLSLELYELQESTINFTIKPTEK